MEAILKKTIELLEKDVAVAWATVVEQKGSTPREAAARMLISSDGGALGSVGGGRLEGEVIEAAGDLFQKPSSRLIDISLTGREVAETEMICGGQAKIYVEILVADDLAFVKSLYEKFLKKKQVFLLTCLDSQKSSFTKSHYFFEKDESGGSLENLPESCRKEVDSRLETGDVPAFFISDGNKGALFLESLTTAPILYIFGGGHISLDLAWFAQRAEFQVVVIDDRKEFANRERFPMALDVKARPYKDVLDQYNFGDDDYVVIVTRGHLYDLEVLREILAQTPGYIGMIGSRRKKKIIYDQLEKEGILKSRLDDVHAPIGIDIKAATPAEISVSIIAEMISVRAETRESKMKNWHV